jgi:KilA-N domain
VTASILRYEEKPIRCEGDDVCLTDLWRAAGGDDSKRPAIWLRQDGTQTLIAFLADNITMTTNHSLLFRSKEGRNGATWAHWQLALAYAKYLSPAFHVWCNTIVRGYMQGAVPTAVVVQEPRHDGFMAALAACQKVGENPQWSCEFKQRIGYLAFTNGITFQRAHGALRKHLGVVSYLKIPASLIDEARRFFDSLARGAFQLPSAQPDQFSRAQLRMFDS